MIDVATAHNRFFLFLRPLSHVREELFNVIIVQCVIRWILDICGKIRRWSWSIDRRRNLVSSAAELSCVGVNFSATCWQTATVTVLQYIVNTVQKLPISYVNGSVTFHCTTIYVQFISYVWSLANRSAIPVCIMELGLLSASSQCDCELVWRFFCPSIFPNFTFDKPTPSETFTGFD